MSDLQHLLDHQIYPALFNRLDSAFPEFDWKRQNGAWTATSWPSDFPYPVGHEKPDRLMVYENRPHWIKVHGHTGQRFLDLVNGGAKPLGKAFPESVRDLCRRAGVDFPERDLTPVEVEQVRQREARRGALEAVLDYACDALQADDAADIREYLQIRGLYEEAVENLHIGWYRSVNELRDFLVAEGQDLQAAKDAALLWRKLEGYIIFPWFDATGHPLTFYGRWPGEPPKGQPKTIALPGEGTKASPLYFDRARRAGHRDVVLVEGVIDAALLQTWGDTRVIACVAAQLSGAQVETLKDYRVKSVTVCLDPDGGGERGTLACVEALAKANIAAYVAPTLPNGFDPDEFVQAEGIDAWKTHLSHAVSGWTYRASQVLQGLSSASPAQERDEAIQQLGVVYAQAPDLEKVSVRDLTASRLGLGKREVTKALNAARPVLRSVEDEYQPVTDNCPTAPVPSGAMVPRCWKLQPELVQTVQKRLPDGTPYETEREVTPAAVVVSARELDIAGGNHRLEVAWRYPDDQRWSKASAPRDTTFQARKLPDLAAQGFPATSQNARQLVDYLSAFEAQNRALLPVRQVSGRLGWHLGDDGELLGFLSGIGGWLPDGKEPVSSIAEAGAGQIARAMRGTGDAKKEREALASASKFPAVLAMLGASLAAPLLRVLDAPNFVLSLSGQTSSGKTSALRVAGSVWGRSDEREAASVMATWDATRVWIERTAAVLDGVPLLLDDTQRARNRQTVAQVLYDIPSGRSRGRGTVTGTAESLTSRTVLISTGETPILDASQQSGTRARVLEIWGAPWGEVSTAAAAQIRSITWSLSDHYGHTGPAWVGWLLDHRGEWEGWRALYHEAVRSLSAELMEHGAVASRLGEYITTISIALSLLKRSGLLPVSDEQVMEVDELLRSQSVAEAVTHDPATDAWNLFVERMVLSEDRFWNRFRDRPPPGGSWIGKWESSDKLVFISPKWVRDILLEEDFPAEGVLRAWAEREWIVTSTGHRTQNTRVDKKQVRMLAVRRELIEPPEGSRPP